MKASPRRTLLIGWDAADWQVALPLMEAGKMPNLQKLVDAGVWGYLTTIRPVLSPMLWTSIATGKRAWKHGIHGFAEPKPGGGVRHITNLSRKAKAVWNIFNQQGWQSNVVGWWPSAPVEPINGVMVSNHYQQAIKNLDEDWPMAPGTVHPERLVEPLKGLRVHPAELENEHILPFIPRAAEIDQEKDPRMASCAKIIAEVSGIHAAATAIMQLEPWDFMAVYYDGIDHFGHGFMRYHPPRQPWVDERDFELYQGVTEAGYRFHDMMLGVLLALAGEDTTVMLISDHGFEPAQLRPKYIPSEPAGPAVEHSPYGIFCLSGPGIAKGRQIHGATLLDIAPTLLHLHGLPVGRDMDGKVLVNCFEEPQQVDWIDSWEAVPGPDGRHPPDKQLAPEDAGAALRQLVDLGYVDEPDADLDQAAREIGRELRFNLAQAYEDAGLLREAAEIYEDLWDQWPRESRFGTRLLACDLQRGDPAIARESLNRLLDRKKVAAVAAKDEIVQLQKELKSQDEGDGRANKDQGQAPDPAHLSKRQQLQRLSRQATVNPATLAYFEGSVLALEGKRAEALEALHRAEGVQTAQQPSLYQKIGEVHRQRGEWAEAEAAYQKALSLQPQNATALLGMARVHLERGFLFDAAAAALEAVELHYENPGGHLLYARALHRLQKPRLAIRHLKVAVALAPHLTAAHRLLSTIHGKLGHIHKAAEHQRLADLSEARRAELGVAPGTRVSRGKEAPEARKLPEELPALPEIIRRTDKPEAKTGSTPALIVVSGLPRSGTSLMMQMLAAGGVPVMMDEMRQADPSNPKGYFELERIKGMPRERDRSWLADYAGSAVKIVAPLLPFIPANIPAKIIFLSRDLREVLQSQQAMLHRAGKEPGDPIAIARAYARQLEGINQLMDQRPQQEILPIAYADAVAEPMPVAEAVAAFLGRKLDPAAMAAVADPSLYRSRA